jgi:hypothetical protein
MEWLPSATAMLWLIGWASSAFLMGLTAGVHCAAMCGPLCHLAQPSANPLTLLGARLVSYALCGAVAASLFAVVARAGLWAQSVQPIMQLALVAVLVHGLVLVATGRPMLAKATRFPGLQVIHRAPPRAALATVKTGALGAGLALLPCGLFYTALSTAALGGTALSGGLSMAAFALGSSGWLWAGFAMHTGRSFGLRGNWHRQWRLHGPRIAGGLAVVLSAIALWHARHGLLVCA